MLELIVAILALAVLTGLFARLASRYPIDSRSLIDGAIVGGHARTAQPLW